MRSSDFDPIIEEFFETYFDFHPTEAAEAGLHDYDELTGPRDTGSIASYVDRLRDLQERLEEARGVDLTSEAALDRELILGRVRGDLFWLDEVETWRKDPRFYVSQMDLSFLLLSRHAPLRERMKSIVARLETFPKLLQAARTNVEEPPGSFVETALVSYRGLPGFLGDDLSKALAGVEDSELQARFAAARDAAVATIRDLTGYLADEVLPEAHGEYALGPDLYRRMNQLFAGVDLPIDDLEEIGQSEIDRLCELGDALAEQVLPGQRLEAALRSLGEDSPEAGALAETAAGDINGLLSFMRTKGIGTLLPGSIEVMEIPAFRRTNFAYIMIPGPFEPAGTGFYFIHPVDDSWSEAEARDFLRRNNRWTLLNTSAHEAYPGHYHHFTHINRAPTKTQRLLTSYVTTEGWAHYTEEMSWREGLAGSNPSLGLAVVQDALLRAVRFICSIGLHTRGMTVEEAEDAFRAIAYQDPVNARQQALRGTYDPEYLNYTLGKLMVMRLREDLEARGEELDLCGFHDEFMATGAPPVPWIARRMLGTPSWDPFR